MPNIDRGLVSVLILLCTGLITALGVFLWALADTLKEKRLERKEKGNDSHGDR